MPPPHQQLPEKAPHSQHHLDFEQQEEAPPPNVRRRQLYFSVKNRSLRQDRGTADAEKPAADWDIISLRHQNSLPLGLKHPKARGVWFRQLAPSEAVELASFCWRGL